MSSYDGKGRLTRVCSETGAILEWLMRDSSGAEVPYTLAVDGSECEEGIALRVCVKHL